MAERLIWMEKFGAPVRIDLRTLMQLILLCDFCAGGTGRRMSALRQKRTLSVPDEAPAEKWRAGGIRRYSPTCPMHRLMLARQFLQDRQRGPCRHIDGSRCNQGRTAAQPTRRCRLSLPAADRSATRGYGWPPVSASAGRAKLKPLRVAEAMMTLLIRGTFMRQANLTSTLQVLQKTRKSCELTIGLRH